MVVIVGLHAFYRLSELEMETIFAPVILVIGLLILICEVMLRAHLGAECEFIRSTTKK